MLAVLTWAAPALADGAMNAVAYESMPAGATVMVRPLDNSDHNMLLKGDFERAFRARGYNVSDDAKLIFSFETFDTAGAWIGGGPNRFVELSNNPDQSGVEAPRVRFNLFNSQRGGILNPDRKEPTRMVSPSTFRIEATIENADDGKRLWQGWSTIDIGAGDNREKSRVMIPVMVEGVGKTVREQAFPVQ